MNATELKTLLGAIADGRLSVDEGLKRLHDLPFEDIGVALIDHHRELRQGAAEVLFGEPKSIPQLEAIVGRMAAKGRNVLATRLTPEKGAALAQRWPAGRYDGEARTFALLQQPVPPDGRGTVLIVSAGTSDLPVAREAAVTARFSKDVESGNNHSRRY